MEIESCFAEEVDQLSTVFRNDLFRFSFSSFDLPRKERIEKILDQIQEVLFPGFFEKGYENITPSKNHLSFLMIKISGELTGEITRALIHKDFVLGEESDPDFFSKNREIYSKEAQAIASEFLSTLPAILEILVTDVEAGFRGDPAAENREQIIMSYPGFYAITVQRIAHQLFMLGVPTIPRIMTEIAHSKTGIDIHPGASIGESFFIDHGTGVVIGETTIIGNHVKLYQGVTLGALSTSGGQSLKNVKRHPTLEDHVTVYSGASVLGGETVIGKNATIGGNVFITQSVPPETTVILKGPEFIINRKNAILQD